MPTLSNSGPPRIPQDGVSIVHVVERVVEFIHLTSQHRVDGQRPQLHACPEDPCLTWHAFVRESGWMP